ncbi:MAG: sugar kinase, partial [Actinomycetes bacterium]
VVTVGDLFTDVIAELSTSLRYGDDTRARISTHGGGATANTAAWLGVDGVSVGVVARVGDDAWGRAALEVLGDHRIQVHATLDRDHATGTCVVLVDVDGERSMASDPGASAFLSPEDLPVSWFAPSGHLHLSGYSMTQPVSRLGVRHAVALARECGMTVSLDPGSITTVESVGLTEFLAEVRGMDLLFPNDDEALALTGARTPESAALALAAATSEVVVKLGRDGALWSDGQRVEHVAAEPVSVVDTTGAGDAFAAGFLAAWLSDRDPAEALRRGSSVAADCVQRVGARP